MFSPQTSPNVSNRQIVVCAAFGFVALHCAFGYFATVVAHVGNIFTGLGCGALGVLVVLTTYRASRSRGTAQRLFALLLTSSLILVANVFMAEWLFFL